MRKYDKKNKMYMFIILIASVILIVIFSFFINKVITNGKIHYDIDAGSVMYDKDKNLVKLDEDGILKIKWNDMYYLMYQDQMYLLGNNAIIYNPKKSQMNLYGKYYEVTSEGEDKVIVHEDETLVNINESKFYKIADRKYLIVDKVIRTTNGELNTTNYLIVELDKSGNAQLYNNTLNLKTFKETQIQTSTYTFDIALEKLYIENEEVDLKKIIGSTNEYVKAEEIEETKPSTDEDEQNQQQGAGGNTQTPPEEDNNQNNEQDGSQNNNQQQDNNNTDHFIDATKTTSIISVTASVGYINVDYVIYDPLDEYESVFVEIYDSNNTLVAVSYFDKTTNNLVIPGLRANVTYKLNFKYSYYDNNKRVEEQFDEASVMMGSPELDLKITKVTSDRIYYKLSLDKDYKLDSVNVNLVSDLKDGKLELTNSINSSTLNGKDSIEGYFEYDDIGSYVTVYLSNIVYQGYTINSNISYKIAMP